jgi:uncharacterized protein (TIGR02996 family)
VLPRSYDGGMDEQAFLEAIRADPGDVAQRLIYADWLEEQGDWRGEYIRRRHDLDSTSDPLAMLKQMLPLFARHDFEVMKWSSRLGFRPLFLCRVCHVPVTLPVSAFGDEAQLNLEMGEDLLPRGFFVTAERSADDGDHLGKRGETAVHLQDAVFTQRHPDTLRLQGCCGPDGSQGLNTICRNAHEIGTEHSDCWMPHALWLDANHIDRV